MENIKFKFKDELGLHARPAGNLVKTASAFKSSVLIKKDGKCASAKGLFAVMGLSIKKNDTVEIEIEGEDEKEAKEAIINFLNAENLAEIGESDAEFIDVEDLEGAGEALADFLNVENVSETKN